MKTWARAQGCADFNYPFLTQKERDIETGLDYFGARYFASTQGRFTSPDPLLSSGSIYDPQTWNRYSYVGNNPLKFVDPTGMFRWSDELGGTSTDAQLEESRKKAEKTGDSKEADRIKDIQGKRTAFVQALQDANSAADGLSGADRAAVKAAIAAYGKPGVDNGVTVAIGDDSNAGVGQTFVDSSGQVIAAFKASQFADKGLFITAAHEGSHVSWAKGWVAGDRNPYINPTVNETEFEANRIGSLTAQGAHLTSLTYPHSPTDVWNSGWDQSDKKALESHRAAAINAYLSNVQKGPNQSLGSQLAFPASGKFR